MEQVRPISPFVVTDARDVSDPGGDAPLLRDWEASFNPMLTLSDRRRRENSPSCTAVPLL